MRHEEGLTGRKVDLSEPAVETGVKLGSLHAVIRGDMMQSLSD